MKRISILASGKTILLVARTFLLITISSFSLQCTAQIEYPLNEVLSAIESGLIPRIQIENDPVFYNLEERMEHYNVPGFSITTINQGNIEASKGFGFGRKKEGIKVGKETIFQAGSISKTVTALLVLKLHETNQLDLDADIRDYLTSWKLRKNKFIRKKEVTLRMLLNHTAGLKAQLRMRLEDIGYSQSDEAPTLNDILDGKTPLQALDFDSYPGETYKYSNQGYNLIQKIIEDVMNEPFETLAQRLILEPFNMFNSTFKTVIPSSDNTNYAYAYRYGEPRSGYWQNTTSKCTGGLYSTTIDLSKLIIKIAEIINGDDPFISAPLAKEMVDGETYGLGIELFKKDGLILLSHGGRNPGYFAYMIIDPKTKTGFSMMTNSDDANELFSEVLRSATHLFRWEFAKPRMITTINIEKAELMKFTGDYLYSDDEEEELLSVQEKNGQLIYLAYDGDESTEYPLGAVSKNTFIDLIDGNELKFVIRDNEIIKISYDKEYDYFKLID